MAFKQSGWKIYNTEMGLLDYGDALWEPAPIYSYKRVKLGDVGYIRRGRFHLLFSAGCPLGSRTLGVDVPGSFEPLDTGHIIYSESRLPGYLCTSTVKEVGGGPACTALFLEPGTTFSFQLTEEQGAVLVTKYYTYREDIELESAFEEYTKRYYDSWVTFARNARHGRDVKPVLVTGVDVTKDFAMIAYSNSSTQLVSRFTASVPPIGSASASVWGTWNTRGLVHTNCGPKFLRPPSPDTPDLSPPDANQVGVTPKGYNQCVFIRYYTMRRRALMFPKVIKAGAGPHDCGSANNHDETLPGLVRSDTNSDAGSDHSGDFMMDYPTPVTIYKPELELSHNVSSEEEDTFDVVAEYIFQNSEAEAVLIHHRDIAQMREGLPEAKISELLDHRPIIVVDGIGVGRLAHRSNQQPAAKLPGTINQSPAVTSAQLDPPKRHYDPRPSSPSPQIMTSPAPTPPQTTTWLTLLTLDRTSDAFTHLARLLLSDQRHRKFEVSKFSEDEATKLIELMEPTILQHANIPGDLKGTAFAMLRRLCGTFGRLPSSCLINEDFKTQEEIPFATRGYTDLWKRDWNGGKVAVKALRFAPDDDRNKTTKRFCKEVLLWKHLNHPNILTFYGASTNQNRFCMVSPWMENGNILNYTRKYPEINRLRLLIGVASGLKYLHRMSLVHGNIRGSNILISDDEPPRALLGDFGLNTIIFDPFSLTKASVNWTAPELLTPDSTLYQPSVESDIYALAMVIYEALTGTPPFARRGKTELACKVVIENERPPRPRDSEKLGFTDKVWGSLERCWEKQPSARPKIDAVSACLKQAAETWVVDVLAFMLASKAGVEQVMNMKEGQAKDFADRLDEALNQIGISQSSGKIYLKYLQRLCGASGILPTSFMLTDGFDHIEPRPFTSGGFADVYKAKYKGQLVVAKALKTTAVDDLENVHKRFAKEVVGWKWLRHENILPFVGVTSIPPPFSMVSVWMENGNIMSFIRATPEQNPFSLLVDVTNGLQYLHQHDFVHGDLKGVNILINSERRACLADFGLATITEHANILINSEFRTCLADFGLAAIIEDDGPSLHKAGGTIRWMAPETLDPERYGYTKRARKKLPSKSTDIYALGMTILEVVTGRRPFEHTSPDVAVIHKVLRGIRPERPIVGFSDALWALLMQTWLEEFESADSLSVRPDITRIIEQLREEAKNWNPTSGLLAPAIPVERKRSLESSTEWPGFPDKLTGNTRDDYRDIARDGSGTFASDLHDILKGIDDMVGPEQPDDDPGSRNTPVPDERSSPTTSSNVIPRGGTRSHQSTSTHQRTKKQKSGVGKAWSKLKKLFMKKFGGGGDQQPLKLSDRLVPERDDEVKWHDLPFLKLSKPAKTINLA